MGDKIKHIFLVLILPAKLVFKHLNSCRIQHTYISMGFLCFGELPNEAMHKTTLQTVAVIRIIFIPTFYTMRTSANITLAPSEQNNF